MKSEKTQVALVNFKTTRNIKDLLVKFSEADRRTLVGELEWLLLEEAKRRGISTDID